MSTAIDIGNWRHLNGSVHDALGKLRDQAFAATDPEIRELVRLRLTALLDDDRESTVPNTDVLLNDEKFAALDSWFDSRLFSARERSCLRFVDQFAMDVARVTDDMIDDLVETFGPAGTYDLVHTVYVIDGILRVNVCLRKLGIR